ncbi:uncharacterized protein FOMMEDRAFT_156814 [Fomitiporia mediterranea MF3/22]|uniref:uncharacterized protein n=1 Tax=Fomitiporia mediterranea (strain MF3/22) TaxID=694068 RepID=UPI0004409484|nr:uncharacterized protein FOMMEDRAFT_156814 [Fomitiporia mediterranea MF3/22]EJD03410.1 hypothetical protein FOMMEDRAFT_156814 [Fomitiporia mediterranea MF3/22]
MDTNSVMTCIIILALPITVSGQLKIDLGIIPSAGGTQHFTRLINIGQSCAMEVILTGRKFNASEARKPDRWSPRCFVSGQYALPLNGRENTQLWTSPPSPQAF